MKFRSAFLLCLAGVALSAAQLVASGAEAALRFLPSNDDSKLRYIIVSGKFEYSDRLDEFSELVRKLRPTFVTFNSEGGNLFKAMALGRLIRQYSLDTFQLKQLSCASACTLAFLGGVNRLADPGSIGVHKTAFNPEARIDVREAVSAVQTATADIMVYISEMGADPALMQLALRYDADDMRYLSKSEMQRFRVTSITADRSVNISDRTPATAGWTHRDTYAPPPAPLAPKWNEAQREAERLLDRPTQSGRMASLSPPPSSQQSDVEPVEPKSGRIRHPKGYVSLKMSPEPTAFDTIPLANKESVSILATKEDWYFVRVGVAVGYLHTSWVRVDQYHQSKFDDRYIQIKSLSTLAEVNEYIRSSPLDLTAFLTPNGWYAIAMKNPMELGQAQKLAESLKSEGKIPKDSFVTYGNAYIRQACCDGSR